MCNKKAGDYKRKELEINKIKNETDAWKVINKYKSKKKNDIISNKISKRVEGTHFILERKVERPTSNHKRDQEGDIEAKLENEEMEKHIKKIKTRKTAG